MKVDDIIHAWKHEEAAAALTKEGRALLPEHPAGALVELAPEALTDVGGGGTFALVTTSNWICAVTLSVTVCDDLTDIFNGEDVQDGGGWYPTNKGYCFAQGTSVRTPTGYQPIESFVPGDAVLTFGLEAGAVHEARVEGLDVHQGSFPVLELRAGEDAVRVTPGHQFHDGEGWKPVERLGSGRVMDLRERSRNMCLVGLRHESTVYNLKVEGPATYSVSEAELLVRDY